MLVWLGDFMQRHITAIKQLQVVCIKICRMMETTRLHLIKTTCADLANNNINIFELMNIFRYCDSQ